MGIWVNVDSFSELEIIDDILKTTDVEVKGPVGLRINVQSAAVGKQT